MYIFKKIVYVQNIKQNNYFLGADIGGTNSNFGFFTIIDGKLVLCFSWHYKSQKIDNFTALVQDLLVQVKNEYGVVITIACFGAAGVVLPEQDFCKPTNLSISISVQELIENTFLKEVFLLNDFSVIGYGMRYVAADDMHFVQKGIAYDRANRAIVGAGTGLGKNILHWSDDLNDYVPVASEGGHADCVAYTTVELEIFDFIQQEIKKSCPVSWEDLLSGNGIQRIYRFFSKTNGIADGKNILPDEIFMHKNDDQRARQTCELYTILYARCAKNFALEALSLGGLYIAGGIAARNIDIFKQEQFYTEFMRCGKQSALLKKIPICVIGDYNISLYGAAAYIVLNRKLK